jgi:hypothetical protein
MNMDNPTPKTPQDLINVINVAQEQLLQVKSKLGALIENLPQSPSTFNYLTQKWQQLSLLQKILLTLVITTPLLLIGIFAQIAVLTALGSALCLFIAMGVYLLENHKNQSELSHEQLKKPIESMIDILSTIMQTLGTSSILLAKEIALLQITNSEVTVRCTQLTEEIRQLISNNTLLDKSLQELLIHHKHLKSTLKTVDETVLEQRKNLERCQKILDETMVAYKINQQELSTKINELTLVKQSLAQEVEKVQQLSVTLKNTVLTFTQLTLTEDQQRTEFLDKFNSFLQNQEETLQKTTQTLMESGAQLSATANELEGNNKRLKGLLDKQEEAVVRLEDLTKESKPKQFKAPISHGLFPQIKPLSIETTPISAFLDFG